MNQIDEKLKQGIEAFEVTESIMEQWQELTDSMAKLVGVPAGLIMRLNGEKIEVFTSSNTENNPYKPKDSEHFFNSGLYCETVIRTGEKLHVPDALKDEDWKDNPDVKLNMISYLGYPIRKPDNTPFGTLCILDDHERHFTPDQENLIIQFRNILESHLHLITKTHESSTTQAKLLEILDKSPFSISIVSVGSKKRLYVNQRNIEIFGARSVEEFRDLDVADSYFNPEKRDENWATFNRYGFISGTEELRKHLDGTIWWCQSDWQPISFDDEKAVMIWHYDITDRKNEADKLEIEHKRSKKFNKLATGRELKMIELKKEIDELLEKAGDAPRYS